eukprot:COSAG02_NODE_587_length_19920_cov_78.898693_3_plen_234_part_00
MSITAVAVSLIVASVAYTRRCDPLMAGCCAPWHADQYRLCPKGSSLTEECFRKHPLEFADDTTTIRYHDDSRPDFEIPAMDVSRGTIPAGSTFRRNPIPACNCDSGMDDGPRGPTCGSVNPMGTCDGNPCLTSASGCYLGTCQYYRDVYEHQPGAPTRTPGCSTGTQFAPPWKEGYGHDQAHVANGGTSRPDGMFVYSMVDNIHVPDAPGDYVLSWRWDCELPRAFLVSSQAR